MKRSLLIGAVAALGGWTLGWGVAAEPPESPPAAGGQPPASSTLEDWQVLVGRWRGVGQIRRGSTRGAWQESGQWAWRHQEQGPSLLSYQSDDGRHIRQATLRAAPGGQLELTVTGAPGEPSQPAPTQRYVGRTIDQRLVLQRVAKDSASASDADSGGLPQRITFRTVARGDRLLVLLERRNQLSGQWQRMAEVGSTRVGSRFGQGTVEIECIVTGGKGTIPVVYGGQTYYVCCSGCRDYFQQHPEKVLAQWRSQQAKKQSARNLGKRGE